MVIMLVRFFFGFGFVEYFIDNLIYLIKFN